MRLTPCAPGSIDCVSARAFGPACLIAVIAGACTTEDRWLFATIVSSLAFQILFFSTNGTMAKILFD